MLYPLIIAPRVAYNILKFAEDKNFVNFSLISPTKIGTRLMNIISSRYEFVKEGRTAIGVCCGMVSQSQIESVSPQLKFPYHGLSLTMHCQDAERYEACVCSIIGKRTLVGQTFKNAMSFQTNVSVPGKHGNCKFCDVTSIVDVLFPCSRERCVQVFPSNGLSKHLPEPQKRDAPRSGHSP